MIYITDELTPTFEKEVLSFPLISSGNNPGELLIDREYLAVAVDDDGNTKKIVGYVLVRPPIHNNPSSIEYIEVLEKYRGQGIGRSLIDRVVLELKRKRRRRVNAYALSGSRGFFVACKFSERSGLMELSL